MLLYVVIVFLLHLKLLKKCQKILTGYKNEFLSAYQATI